MTQAESGAHLRRWDRHKIDVRLRVTFSGRGETNTAFGRANNLSYGGMGAYIPCAIPVGATVVLEVSFPYSPVELKVSAVVRSCEGFRYGLEFVNVPAETRAIIQKNCSATAE